VLRVCIRIGEVMGLGRDRNEVSPRSGPRRRKFAIENGVNRDGRAVGKSWVDRTSRRADERRVADHVEVALSFVKMGSSRGMLFVLACARVKSGTVNHAFD
jgi:hypothetical protein